MFDVTDYAQKDEPLVLLITPAICHSPMSSTDTVILSRRNSWNSGLMVFLDYVELHCMFKASLAPSIDCQSPSSMISRTPNAHMYADPLLCGRQEAAASENHDVLIAQTPFLSFLILIFKSSDGTVDVISSLNSVIYF